MGEKKPFTGLVSSTRSEIESHRPLARNKSWLDPLADETHIPFAAISLHLKRSAAVWGSAAQRNEKNEALPQEQQTANTNTTTPGSKSPPSQHHNPLSATY